MKLVIEIDFKPPDWKAISNKLESEVSKSMSDLKNKIETTWREKASQKLKETKDDYNKALTFDVNTTNGTITATIDDSKATGTLKPSYLETGSKPYSLRPGFLKGGLNKRFIPVGDGLGNKFRTITSTQNPATWMHPGIGSKGSKAVYPSVESEVPKLVNDVFGSLMSRVKV